MDQVVEVKKNMYIAGPMRGYPEFNFPAFKRAADDWRGMGFHVFNPAERDEEVHGTDFSKKYKTGDEGEATKDGFSLRRALGDDLAFICHEADIIYMLRGWEKSAGANAEWSTAKALGLEIWYE